MRIMQEIEEGEFVLKDGQLYTMCPLTTLKSVMEEMKQEFRKEILFQEGNHELFKEFGRAIEYITKNDIKVYHKEISDTKTIICIFIPFEGNNMVHQRTINKRTEITEGEYKLEKIKERLKIYIPNGWLGLEIDLRNNLVNDTRYILIPKVKGKDPLSIMESPDYNNLYWELHPHKLSEANYLCDGMNQEFPNDKFNISLAVEMLNACLNGGKERGTSLFNYNKRGPAKRIGDCCVGFKSTELKEKGKSDDEIINELIIFKKKKNNPTPESRGCRICGDDVWNEDTNHYVVGTNHCENCSRPVCEDCGLENGICETCDVHEFSTCEGCSIRRHHDRFDTCEICERMECDNCRGYYTCYRCGRTTCDGCSETDRDMTTCKICQEGDKDEQ